MSEIKTAAVEAVSNRTKWTYTLGGIGRDMAYNLFSGFLLTYILLTKSVNNSQFALISTIIIICRIWDAINDPVMGGIIENTRSKYGKFKPWILIGAVTNSIVIVLTFTLPIQGTAFIVAFIFFYLLWDITYTMNDIGYWSMLPSLTSDPKSRTTLAAMTNLFAAVGAIAAIGLIPILTTGGTAIGGNAITAYAVVAVIIALAFVGCQLLTVFGVKERQIALPSDGKMSVKKMAKTIFKNDQLLWIALAMLLYNFGSSLILAFGSLYAYFEFGYNGTYVTLMTAAYAVATILSNIIYPKIATKLKRKQIQLYAILTAIVGYVIFFLAGIVFPMSIITLSVALFFMGFGQITYYAVLTISISNTVEYNEYIGGTRDESLIFAVRPFMAKLGSSLQQLAIMAVYLIVGVTAVTERISDVETAAKMGTISSADRLTEINGILSGVTPAMKLSLRICMTIIPVALLIGSLVVISLKYKINENYYDKILNELQARKQKDAEK